VRRLAAALLPALALALAPAAPARATEPRGWHPKLGDARAFAATRRGEVAIAVRTRTRHWAFRGTVQYRSASVVKAMLLVAYLRRADVRDRDLRADERALLDPMIRFSDNKAADAVHERVGLPALTTLAHRAGMRHFSAHPVWGGSLITADDQARFFRRIDRLVPEHHRSWAMGLLRGITAGQRWGMAEVVPKSWTIAFKGGWGRGVTRQVTHQAALLTRGRERLAVAVLTADNPSTRYGAATIRGVAQRLLRGLDGRLVGRVTFRHAKIIRP
jgi:beta-lactamase class A